MNKNTINENIEFDFEKYSNGMFTENVDDNSIYRREITLSEEILNNLNSQFDVLEYSKISALKELHSDIIINLIKNGAKNITGIIKPITSIEDILDISKTLRAHSILVHPTLFFKLQDLSGSSVDFCIKSQITEQSNNWSNSRNKNILHSYLSGFDVNIIVDSRVEEGNIIFMPQQNYKNNNVDLIEEKNTSYEMTQITAEKEDRQDRICYIVDKLHFKYGI